MNRSRALLTLALVFCASAALRAGDVVAQLSELAERKPAATVIERADPPIDWPKRAITPAGETTTETAMENENASAAVLSAMRERAADLDRRERALAERQQKLEAAEVQIRKRLDALEKSRADLEKLVAKVENAQVDDIDHLSKMYARMKPKQAATIFDAMDVKFAAGFLGHMKPEVSALIMANMDAERAYAVSLVLAGRNHDAGRAAGTIGQ